MDIPPVIQKIIDHPNHRELARMIGRSKKFLWTVQRQWMDPNYKMYKVTLDSLYKYFKLPKDEYYNRSVYTKKSTDTTLGFLFRNRRIELGMTADEVAQKIKGTEREIVRIEIGDALPPMCGWYITELLKLYKFSEEEEHIIRWYIVIFRDLKKLTRRYELCLKKNDMER